MTNRLSPDIIAPCPLDPERRTAGLVPTMTPEQANVVKRGAKNLIAPVDGRGYRQTVAPFRGTGAAI
jgi:hypothetical protein